MHNIDIKSITNNKVECISNQLLKGCMKRSRENIFISIFFVASKKGAVKALFLTAIAVQGTTLSQVVNVVNSTNLHPNFDTRLF